MNSDFKDLLRCLNEAGAKHLIVFAILAFLAGCQTARADLRPTDLRCEDLTNPLGIDNLKPRLSWELRSNERAQSQTAYQIQVASTPTDLARGHVIQSDSGKVASSDLSTSYTNLPLHSKTRHWWRARVWDARGKPSSWSAPAMWSMGLLHPEDWQGDWITAPASIKNGPLLRSEFTVKAPVWRATAFVTGLGYYELYVNGKRVGDHVLDPAQTDYRERALYVTYDITHYLKPGRNAVGVMIGNGWFNQDRVWGGMSYGRPCARCFIEIDGGVFFQNVSTGGDWRCSSGPVIRDNVYAGEEYDARLEQPGWTEPGFDDSRWQPAKVVPSPARRLAAQTMLPIKRIQVLKPAKSWSPNPGSQVFDFAQNFAGWARIRVAAPSGTAIKLRYSEAIDSKGNLDTASTGVFATGVEQIDTYVCGSSSVYEPRFTYHGFRYVEVSGLGPGVRIEGIEGVVVHSALERAGRFESSDSMLNRIHRAALWTERSNLHGIPTDCPAREKCGWLGDAGITAEMTLYNFRITRFWDKYLRDIWTSWQPDLAGHDRPGDVAPGKRITAPNGNVDWGASVALIPWYLYLYTGDLQLLREHYPYMTRFVRNVQSLAKDGIVDRGYGDWCPPGSVQPVETPPALTVTATYYQSVRAVECSARALGRPEDEAEFAEMGNRVKAAFIRQFYDPNRHSFGSQTGDAMALALGLAPTGEDEAVATDLTRDITERHAGHHSTGIFGSRWLYDALCEHGSGATVMSLLHNTTYPSIGNLFAKGATTLWECWGEPELDKKWGARSLNHPMQGGFDAWFYQGLAGIRPDPESAGFKHFTISPQMTPGLRWVRAEYHSIRGPIESSWRRDGIHLIMEISVPPGSSATVYVPATDAASIKESAGEITKPSSARLERLEKGRAIFSVASGRYRFESRTAP